MLPLLALACLPASLSTRSQTVPDSALPTFRAADVRVVRDTAWFFSTAADEGVTRHVMVGFVPASNTWICVRRRWRDVDAVNAATEGGGAVLVRSGGSQPLGAPFHLERSSPSLNDLREKSLLLTDTSKRPTALRLALPPSERRRLYRLAGGRASTRQSAPNFSVSPSRWAAARGRLAFAFPAASPPRSDVRNYTLPEKDQRYPPELSGFLIIDSVTRRTTTLATPTLIERGWLGLALTSGELFAVPAQIDDGMPYAHAPARSIAPQLARYSFESNRWSYLYERDLPIANSPVMAIAADRSHVYVVAEKQLSVLDLRSRQWNSRFYDDTTYTLADGADTTVTRLDSRVRLPVLTTRASNIDDDSAAFVDAFVDHLRVRHTAAFKRAVLALLPNDQVRDVGNFVLDMERRANELGDIDPPFGPFNDTIAQQLARPEFVPFLHESMRRSETAQFAAQSLTLLGDSYLRDALRETLNSGTVAARLWAADTLINLGDPAGLLWMRAQIADSMRSVDVAPDLGFRGGWSLGTIFFDLSTRDDSASVAPMIALLRMPDGDLAAQGARQLLESLLAFPSLAAQRHIAHAVEQRPWLWTTYVYQLERVEHSKFESDPDIHAIVERMAAAENARRAH